MKSLSDIADALRADASGPLDGPVLDVTFDSRRVGPGTLFVAITGLHHDGNTFVDSAMAEGAAGIISERQRPDDFTGAWLRVPDARRALARAAAIIFDHPSEWL